MPTRFSKRRKDKLFKKLRRLAPAATREIVFANEASAQEMVDLARSYAPVKTGRLRDSITVTGPGQQTPLYSAGGGARVVPKGSYMITAGHGEVRYAHLIEFGAAPHIAGGQFAGAQHPGNKAQPFFFPAYRIVRRKHRTKINRAIRTSIKKVVR